MKVVKVERDNIPTLTNSQSIYYIQLINKLNIYIKSKTPEGALHYIKQALQEHAYVVIA